MPLPKPRPNEPKETYMNRCMADSTMRREFKPRSQRFAVCQTQWDNKK